MHSLSHKEKELLMKIDTEGLSTTQVRLIKTIHSLMANVLASDEESEYFETSAELMKKAAELIKHANFSTQNTAMSYGDQAVEFAVDTLNELMDENKMMNIDN
jgi:uncharacterized protein YaaN involved in tellurite resistance